MESISSFNVNAINYKLTKKVADIILDMCDQTVIFGGYVRDMIIHDHHATQFYEHSDTKEFSYKEKDQKYNDPTFLPEHSKRTLVPVDIDCYMPTTLIDQFVKTISNNKLKILKHTQRARIHNYFESDDNVFENLKLDKFEIGFDASPLLINILTNMPRVCVDVVHADQDSFIMAHPPFAHLDFSCNGLIIKKDRQIRLSQQLETRHSFTNFKKMSDIIQKLILNEIEMIAFPYQTNRVNKMIKKGMTSVSSSNGLRIKSTSTEDSDNDETCIICLGDFTENKSMVKDSCCAARYHSNCFIRMYKDDHYNGSCPMCRNNMHC
jgi:hypothetical protein